MKDPNSLVAECPVGEIYGRGPAYEGLQQIKNANAKGLNHLKDIGNIYRGVSRTPSGSLVPDVPHEGGDFKVSHYSVYCQTCKHPSLWHWKAAMFGQKGEGCRGFNCFCKKDIPGEPIPIHCDVCTHPLAWHGHGPTCNAINCTCGRTAT